MTDRPFLYFDLGNVLTFFDHDLACRQMAQVAGVPAETVREVVFDSSLQWRLEAGAITSAEFYAAFCSETGTRPPQLDLEHAASSIFAINPPMKAVVSQLKAAGYALGVLSNTCEIHWRYVSSGRYGIIPGAFSVLGLSFELGAIKPDPAIYHAAARLAGRRPAEIFFVDDRMENVEAARGVGIDAELFTTPAALVAQLRQRGLRFNY